MLKIIFCFIIISVSSNSFGQNNVGQDKIKIASVFENYFHLEREAIHLHLNKTVFLHKESIWFKGYVINKKDSKPLFTTNIFILLLDANGNQVSEQLVFGTNGVFTGKIDLKNNLDSGKYYVQAYTNWMNNFSEDESSISTITIINPAQGIKNYKKLDTNSLKIEINPEGGNYIKDVENNLGISLLDCLNNTINNAEGTLQSMDGKIIKTFKINELGYAKINIVPTDIKLKIVFDFNENRYEKNLPIPNESGFALIVKDDGVENKININVSTNKQTFKTLSNDNLFLVVNKNHNAHIQEFRFDAKRKINFEVEKKHLFHGINTIRIIDSDLNQQCERLIYFDSLQENLGKTISIQKSSNKTNQATLAGINALSNSSLSISTLPEHTKTNDYNKITINVGLNINPYLTTPIENPYYYFKNFDAEKKAAFDLLLLNQSSAKYNWNNMKMNVPKANYSFDVGLSLQGKINQQIKNKTSYKVKLLSYASLINLTSDVSEEGNYFIDKFVVADSTDIELSLLKLPDLQKTKNNLNPLVLNRNRPFNKPLKIKSHPSCLGIEFEFDKTPEEYPGFAAGAIQLDEVGIESKYIRPKLTFENEPGNFLMKGYKIDPSYYNMPLINYIASKGFKVTRSQEGGEISISSGSGNTSFLSGGSSGSPEIFINDRLLFSFNELDVMQMSEIDEIFINRIAIVPGLRGRIGLIKIYTKNNFQKAVELKSPMFLVKKGFSKSTFYEAEKYANPLEKGFTNYGVIDWNAHVVSEKNGEFTFNIGNFEIAKVVINIEGMTSDGKLTQQELLFNPN
jgi:hypothetical protein